MPSEEAFITPAQGSTTAPSAPDGRAGNILAAAVLAACVVAVFHFFGNSARGYIDTASVFYWWGVQWFTDGADMEHGPIVLGLAAWLFWRNLKEGRDEENPPRPWIGLALVIAGLALHLAGYLVQQTRISIIALLGCLWGAAYLLGGRRYGNAAFFPLALMVFAIPMQFLTDTVGFHLRMWVIGASHLLADVLGFDVVREGTQLRASDSSFQYDVAPACSGIRSLLALSALCAVVAYVSFKSFWRRALVVLLALPFAFVGNVVRIFSIIVVAAFFGEDAGTWVHDNLGLIVFIIVLGLTLGTVSLVSKWMPEAKEETPPEDAADQRLPSPAMLPKMTAGVVAGVVLLVSVGLAGATQVIDRLKVNYAAGIELRETESGVPQPTELPRMLDADWLGSEWPITEAEREVLPEDTGFARKFYRNLLGHEVGLAIVLSGRDRSSIHRPELCLKGAGWNGTEEVVVRELDVPAAEGGKLSVSFMRIAKRMKMPDGSVKTETGLFCYYFVSSDTTVPTHHERMLRMATDRLFKLKTDRWAYVSLHTPTPDGEEAGIERIEEVLNLALPRFQTVEVDGK